MSDDSTKEPEQERHLVYLPDQGPDAKDPLASYDEFMGNDVREPESELNGADIRQFVQRFGGPLGRNNKQYIEASIEVPGPVSAELDAIIVERILNRFRRFIKRTPHGGPVPVAKVPVQKVDKL